MELKNYPAPYVLFGALLAMGNRLQAAGDRFYDEITTKQWFVLAVLETFSAPPTLGELARGVGSSHQNVKQLVLKLQQKGYVALAQDGREARLYAPAGDAGALAQALTGLLADAPLAAALGQAARRRALAAHDPAANADAMAAIYQQILAENSSGRTGGARP